MIDKVYFDKIKEIENIVLNISVADGRPKNVSFWS